MTKNQKIATLENRVAALEKIITKSAIFLENDVDSTEKIAISFINNEFKISKVKTTIHQEEQLLINQDNL